MTIESQTISTLASRLEIAALADPEPLEVQELRERVKRADALVAALSADLRVARQALAEGDRAYTALKLKFVVALRRGVGRLKQGRQVLL